MWWRTLLTALAGLLLVHLALLAVLWRYACRLRGRQGCLGGGSSRGIAPVAMANTAASDRTALGIVSPG